MLQKEGAEAIFVRTDVSNLDDVTNYLDETIKAFGKIDVFFNNAGISGSGVCTLECSEEEFEAIVNVNLKGAFYGLKYVANEMLKQVAYLL